MFLNLSNHPSRDWGAPQRAAAEALGGQILDLPFPSVPSDAGAEEVAALAAKIVSEVSALAPAAVMVEGEFTLTFCIVAALEAEGVPCYAATTRRVAELSPLPLGATEKRSRFEFVRFRRFSLVRPRQS